MSVAPPGLCQPDRAEGHTARPQIRLPERDVPKQLRAAVGVLKVP